jgi:hypothetical protein
MDSPDHQTLLSVRGSGPAENSEQGGPIAAFASPTSELRERRWKTQLPLVQGIASLLSILHF